MFRFAARPAWVKPACVLRLYQTGASRVEGQVESGGTELAEDAQLKTAMEQVDPSRVDKVAVWGLWNEGNLFSMSVPELALFLQRENVELKAARKSSLVRQVEEVMAAFSPNLTTSTEDTVSSISQDIATNAHIDEYATTQGDVFDEADDYGDWGADPSFEEKRGVDFMSLAPGGNRSKTQRLAHLGSHAFQLLHEETTSDVALGGFDASKLPGCAGMEKSFAPVTILAEDANRLAFRKAFQWCTHSLWNLGLDGEINIGAGKALYRRAVAKRNRTVLPTWTCQEHLTNVFPYSWYAVAHDSNVSVMEQMASDLGMQAMMDAPETSFKLCVLRSRDLLDIELNAELEPTLVNKPWERIYMCHYLRNRLPDLRYLVRARRAIKKKIVETYLESRMIQLDNDTAQSVLSPELGDLVYCCERVKRRWATQLDSGVHLSLVETRRTPLITDRQGDDGERLEYELIANIPQQVEHVDLHNLSDELWARGTEMATLLEDGMAELQAHTMSSSAAFEPISVPLM